MLKQTIVKTITLLLLGGTIFAGGMAISKGNVAEAGTYYNQDKTVSVSTHNVSAINNKPSSKEVFTVTEDGSYYVEADIKAKALGWGSQALLKQIGANINNEIKEYETMDAHYSTSANEGFRTFSYSVNKVVNLKRGQKITINQLYENGTESSNSVETTINTKITKLN